MNIERSAKITLWCGRGLSGAICVLVLAMPGLLRWYQRLRPLGPHGAAAILIGFYCCAPIVLYALRCIDRLVGHLLEGAVFIPENVRLIRGVCRCCGLVSLVCLPAAFFYPPLIFLTVIMAFLALAVSVVKNVMAAAVEIREENDLTV